jgi:hypothetical protein
MGTQNRLEAVGRSARNRSDSWADVQAPHPGVRDPRSVRIGDWPPLVNAAIIATCAFITAFAILSASMASPVGTVETWSQWSSEGGGVCLEHPAGWAVRDLGGEGQLHLVVMRSPWVRIHVMSESGLGARARYAAVETLHRSVADIWENQVFGELEEGQAAHTVIGGRRAVWSQFKYRGEYIEEYEPMTGYRATILGSDRAVIAGAVAPSENWSEFKPIALHVLKSIRFGDDAG